MNYSTGSQIRQLHYVISTMNVCENMLLYSLCVCEIALALVPVQIKHISEMAICVRHWASLYCLNGLFIIYAHCNCIRTAIWLYSQEVLGLHPLPARPAVPVCRSLLGTQTHPGVLGNLRLPLLLLVPFHLVDPVSGAII